MKKVTSSKRLTFAGLALWFALVGCGLLTTTVNDVRTESQSVNLDSATSANIEIEFPAGELKVQSGTNNLMDASFRYNVRDWQPRVQYSENGTQGVLRVSQPGNGRVPVGGRLINEWEIQLNENIPMDLLIRTGGERRLSDFLLWEAAYAELLFLDRLWPDFGEADLAAAIRDFGARERRFGGLTGVVAG